MSSPANCQRMEYLNAWLMILLAVVLVAFSSAAGAQLMIIGNDEKVTFGDDGQLVFSAPGKDTVTWGITWTGMCPF